MTTLVLASGSPRRRELLGRFDVLFDVRPADVDEAPSGGEVAVDLVRRLALAKAQAVMDAAPEDDVVVLAADTVVVLGDVVLGKPVDADHAAEVLRSLSGHTHQVLTGVAVASRAGAVQGADPPPVGGGGRPRAESLGMLGPAAAIAVEVVATEVTLVELSDEDIAWYVATGEPLDKAGAYGIQGLGAQFVASIDGPFDNVVGLPLATTRRLLAAAGIAVPDNPE